MAWSGGSFTRLGGTTRWADERDAGTEITAATQDTHDNDLVTGINQCINKDGSNAFTGDADLGSNKITNLAAAVASNDAVNFNLLAIRQIQYSKSSSDSSAIGTSWVSALSDSITLSYSDSTVVCIAFGHALNDITSGSLLDRYGNYRIRRTSGTATNIVSGSAGRILEVASASPNPDSRDTVFLMGYETPGAGTHTYSFDHSAPNATNRSRLLGATSDGTYMLLLECKP